MSTWILILTLTTASSQGGTAIHSVAGFKDQTACEVAANAWIKSASIGWHKPIANCVEQKK